MKVANPSSALRRRNVEGFYDAHGFHPIRADRDYDPDRASDTYGDWGTRKRRTPAQIAAAKKRKRSTPKGRR